MKYDNARFNFKITAKESEFLKSWNKLRRNKDFQDKLVDIKNQLSKPKNQEES